MIHCQTIAVIRYAALPEILNAQIDMVNESELYEMSEHEYVAQLWVPNC